MQLLTLLSFAFFTGLVGLLTLWLTRRDRHDTSVDYFLAGRSLTAGYIAGSLLLTNLSTEQLVGLNGAAFGDGLSVLAWEVIAALALVVMALFFLRRYLKSGIATVPQFLEKRFDSQARTITSVIFIVAYAGILLPIILYTGATGLAGILNLRELTGIPSDTAVLWLSVWLIGLIGSVYAIFGGLRTVAVSDTLNGFGLLVGGGMIIWFGLQAVHAGGPVAALSEIRAAHPEKFNSLGGPGQSVPFWSLFTGVLLLNLFYWCTNQQIIQRAFAARNLAEGQKGVLLAGTFKVLAPLILVLPGIVAFYLYGRVALEGQRLPVKAIAEQVTLVARDGQREVLLHDQDVWTLLGTQSLDEARRFTGQSVPGPDGSLTIEHVAGPGVVIVADTQGRNQFLEDIDTTALVSPRRRDQAYGLLVRSVLPRPLAGFFAAVMVGAILSSFNSALNSTATLFSLGVYRDLFHPGAEDRQVIRAGKVFGCAVALLAMSVAPLLEGQKSIFAYLQKMNGLYFIPIFAVVLVGMLSKRVPAVAAKLALVLGFAAIASGYFVPGLAPWVERVGEFHFLGIVFVSLVLLMLGLGWFAPRATPWQQEYTGEVDLTPWRFAWPAGLALGAVVLLIYICFADLSVIW